MKGGIFNNRFFHHSSRLTLFRFDRFISRAIQSASNESNRRRRKDPRREKRIHKEYEKRMRAKEGREKEGKIGDENTRQRDSKGTFSRGFRGIKGA